jgi:GNAT superfamily N-acetyltransferase
VFDPTVRRGSGADVDQVELLEAEARARLIDQRGGERWLATHPARRTAEWVAALESGSVHIAELDRVVVGYLVLDTATDVARIEEVYVTPGAREVGFGDGLLESAVEAARASGCKVIEGEALPGDRDTKNLYERAGITARLIVVSTPL